MTGMAKPFRKPNASESSLVRQPLPKGKSKTLHFLMRKRRRSQFESESESESEREREGEALTSADLTDANLSRAILTDAQIDQKHLDEACGSDAVLPPGLTLKPCPSQTAP
jgi:uncharacterized protein YjbI with pentapeptide repeats